MVAFDPTEWMPGAVHRPLPAAMDGRNYSSKRRRRADGIVLHTAANTGSGYDHWRYWSRAAVGVSSHFYIDRDGTITQLVARSQTSWTSVQGCNRTIGIETQGHPTEPWTPQQVLSLARVIAWAAGIEGWPIQAMPDRRTGTKGIGYHDMPGPGELWNPNAHYCPGSQRVAQIPTVLALARQGGTLETKKKKEEEEIEMKYAGVAWTDQGGKRRYAILCPGSGFFTEWIASNPRNYNNPIAATFGTGSFASITESHATALKASCAAVREGRA